MQPLQPQHVPIRDVMTQLVEMVTRGEGQGFIDIAGKARHLFRPVMLARGRPITAFLVRQMAPSAPEELRPEFYALSEAIINNTLNAMSSQTKTLTIAGRLFSIDEVLAQEISGAVAIFQNRHESMGLTESQAYAVLGYESALGCIGTTDLVVAAPLLLVTATLYTLLIVQQNQGIQGVGEVLAIILERDADLLN